MKISKYIIYSLIAIFIIPLFSNFNYVESYEGYDIVPEIDSIMYINLTVIDEFQAKVVMTHFYSFNKTYLNDFSNNINSLNKTINLGVKISLNNSGFIRTDEAIAKTSLGEMKIIFFNESILETEQINTSLLENETIFYKITYYITGFAWGIPSINYIRIPLNFNLNNENICDQQLNLKITLPYNSKINENDEKYISFFGYPLYDTYQMNENFIDKMLSGEPLILFFSNKHIGTELSLFPYIDYYTSNVPKITLKYDHEFDIDNYRINENLKIKNRNVFPLYLLESYTSEGCPYYTIINSSEKRNYDDVFELSPSNGSFNKEYNNKIPLDYKLIDRSFFGWGKRSFPFERYELSHNIPYKINFNSDSLISYFVDYNLEIIKDNIFQIDQESSYYSIVPTIIYIPPIFDDKSELIKDRTYYGITKFDTKLNDNVNGMRILLDLVPKEFNKDCNYSVYRLYSTWCNAESKKIQDQTNDYYIFEKSDFEVDNLQNEITIYYHIEYYTESVYKNIFYLMFAVAIILPILVLVGDGLTLIKKKRHNKIVLLAIFITEPLIIFVTCVTIQPKEIPMLSLFTIIPLIVSIVSIFIGYIILLVLYKIHKNKKPLCPKCKKRSKVRERSTKTKKWICDRCKIEFNADE